MRLRMATESRSRLLRVIVCSVVVLSPMFMLLQSRAVGAAQITTRSLLLQSGDSHGTSGSKVIDGGSTPGGIVRHHFTFTLPSTGNLGSIKFTYCTQPGAISDPCTAPTGLSVASATLETDTLAGSDSDFSMQGSIPASSFYITRTAASIGVNTIAVIGVNNVTNPSDVNTAFYVRISSYPTEDASGTATDYGVVAASTGRDIVLTGTMPESLVFCAAEDIEFSGQVPDCANATDGAIEFNQLFSPSATAYALSEIAASTNGNSGYAISVMGPTLTSGSNTITAMSAAATSSIGTSQFGMNLKQNTITGYGSPVGAEVTPSYDIPTKYLGVAATGYGTAAEYKFTPTSNFVAGDETEISKSGDNVATASGPTNAQIFTATYIVNVPGSQPAGAYTTTLTYICTANF